MAVDSLWGRLDTAFAAAFDGEMGAGGVYPQLALTGVAVNETWDPWHGNFPRLIVYSISARVGQGEHGGGGVQRLEVAYPYMAVAIASAATYNAARVDAQVLFERMLQVLARSAPILQAAQAADPTSSHQARRLLFERGGASGIEVRGREGANSGRFLGLAILAWNVETRT